ncbi:MAG: hypothetical protein H6981_04665 [Gammaproteobacteria bacterium]|nr:hypothetical protein [Gammaproteobacteria bacterium]
MSRERTAFIRHASAEFLPFVEFQVDKAIAYAERLWERLSERGHGDHKAAEPRASRDWYRELGDQREAFDKFWSAFGLKRGRNEAAMTWGQKIKPDADTAARIIRAAKAEAEARRLLPAGSTPIYAQGWLALRRWDDHDTTPTPDATARAKADARRELLSEIASLRRLLDGGKDEAARAALTAQITALEARL